MPLDLNRCSGDCMSCIKNYKKKYGLEPGHKFEIECMGILEDEEFQRLLQDLEPDERITAGEIVDPVQWASANLDWHCLDPDGAIWKRKNPAEYYKWLSEHPDEDVYGSSRYHRPYQALMLRCTSQFKIFRIGRQAGKTESLVVSMLWHLFTKPGIAEDEGFKIVVITPFLEQIDLIFTRLEQLVRSSSVLKNSIARSVKAPNYTIQLYNNSRIKGFTAGTKSGGNAAYVRGQAAHMLVFDEADYLSAEDMDSALAIVINHPLASVWMSSTPTGKREKFYETCFMKDWKEFYFPSQVNPLWDERTEKLFRNQMTEIGYKHEVLAEFGEQEEGVFQNAYVQRARASYEYKDMEYNPNWTYTIGVDWNDTKNGTTVVVMGFNPTHKKFYIVNRVIVSRDGWTQLDACEKIAELNRLWNPLTIYLDAGHGGTQWEVLRKFGYDSSIDPTKGPNHPDSKIKDRLVRYDFGAKVEARDLWTKQIVKKDAKPFLVENTVRRFEAQDIRFPKSDELLEKQLLGYVIDRVGQTGRPVYKATNEVTGDHILDAVMLGLMGFTMEVSPIGKPKWSSSIAFSGRIGERTEPDVHQGDTVIRSDRKHKIQDEKDKHRPSMGRTLEIAEGEGLKDHSLPAANTSRNNQIRPWAWNGFFRDEPAPRVRTLTEAERDARRRMGLRPRMVGRPRRKNI